MKNVAVGHTSRQRPHPPDHIDDPNARAKLAEVSFALLDVIIGRWAQMAASLVLLSRGAKFSYQGRSDCRAPCPGPEGAAVVP